MEPGTDSRFNPHVQVQPSGTISCGGDDWEPMSPTVPIHSTEFLNEMDLTDEDTWEENFTSSADSFPTTLKTDDKVDWEWTDWMRPDRLYAQARRREDDPRTVNKSAVTKVNDNIPNLTSLNGRSRNGSGGYQTTGTSKRKAVKRDWFGNEIFQEDDWNFYFAVAKYYNDREETAVKCIRV